VGGELALDILPRPLNPVSVPIAGQDAEVVYAHSAGGFLNNLTEVRVRVPSTAEPGAAVPIELIVGGVVSQPGLNISVK
jgi:uncharacterized protein (TIGR03437 family)